MFIFLVLYSQTESLNCFSMLRLYILVYILVQKSPLLRWSVTNTEKSLLIQEKQAKVKFSHSFPKFLDLMQVDQIVYSIKLLISESSTKKISL